MVWGDDARLRQVVGNLLNNALTHTPPGTRVVVRLRSEPGMPDQAPVAVLEVADEGPGLSPDQAERVFERFYRVDSARTRPAGSTGEPDPVRRPTPGGTGLGLAIVAALVRAHQGKVTVDSTPGQGATFRVTLPLVADDGGATDDEAVAARSVGSGPSMIGKG